MGNQTTTKLTTKTTTKTTTKLKRQSRINKKRIIMSGKAKKAAPKKAAGPSMIFLICKAIGVIKSGSKGASRAAIANYLCNNNGKTAGGRFNASLRNAIKKGLESGALRQGDSAQRF